LRAQFQTSPTNAGMDTIEEFRIESFPIDQSAKLPFRDGEIA
jgi:hypothetical protein